MASIESIHGRLVEVESELIAVGKQLDEAHEKLDTLKYASCIIVVVIVASFAAGAWLF